MKEELIEVMKIFLMKSAKTCEEYSRLQYSMQELNDLNNIDGFEGDLTDKKQNKNVELVTSIKNYGFFDLEKVSSLNVEGKSCLIKIICSNKIPYCIAMFKYLGFLEFLSTSHFKTKDEMVVEISKWFKSDKRGRTIRGNIDSFSKKEDTRYTAKIHEKIVERDYNKLK